MALTPIPYAAFLVDLGAAVHDFAADNTMVALLTNSYTPNAGSHASFADIAAFEVAGNGYTAGGAELGNKSWAYDNGLTAALLTADPVLWSGLTLTTRYAVVYKGAGTQVASKLISYVDFGTDRVYATEPFQLSFPSGVVQLPAL